MKFESQRAKLDLLQDDLRRPYSVPMAAKVEQIMDELESRIDDMENQSSRLYHLNRPAEYNEYVQVKKVFDNYYIVATNYLAQSASAASTAQVQIPDESKGAIPKTTRMYSSYVRNKYMYANIPRICVLLERSVERESKRLDVVSLTFELRVTLLKQ